MGLVPRVRVRRSKRADALVEKDWKCACASRSSLKRPQTANWLAENTRGNRGERAGALDAGDGGSGVKQKHRTVGWETERVG